MTKFKTSSPMPSKQPRKEDVVIAIDPGFDRIGVAVMQKSDGKDKLFFSECIRTSAKDKKEERLLVVGSRIKELINEWQPEVMAIETLFFNQNASSAMGVSEARGVIVYEAMCGGLELYEYSPQAIKIAVTGYGKATKSQVETMVRKLVTVEATKVPKLDDEIDAIAVGITHIASSRSSGYPHK